MENRLIFDSHPLEDFLEEYAFDRLSELDCAEFEEHLLVCQRCQHQSAQTDEYISLMKRGAMGWQSDKASRATASQIGHFVFFARRDFGSGIGHGGAPLRFRICG